MPVLSTLGAAIANVYGFTSGLIKDQYFNLVSLLLPGNGTDGKQNRTFKDSSVNDFLITPNGNATQGTFSPFSQTGWGAYFAGSGARVSTTAGSQFAFGTGDFTVEFWMYPTSSSSNVGIFDTRTSNNNGLIVRLGDGASNPNVVSAYVAGTELNTKAITYNSWQHVAIVRSSGNGVIYVNGVGSTSKAASGDCSQTGCLISALYDAVTSNFIGYLSNFRVVKGRAVYTSDFTAPTSNLGATSGGSSPPTGTQTSLLTLQSNRFVDNGGLATPNTLTITNSVSVTPFAPFAPTQSYSASAVGGSGYFDGTLDSLTGPTSNAAFAFGTGAYSVEAWVYLTGFDNGGVNSAFVVDCGGATNAFTMIVNTNGSLALNKYGVGGVITGNSGKIALNSWNHIAICRNSTASNDTRLFVNGVLDVTGTDSNDWTVNTTSTFGGAGNTTTQDVIGYLSGIRIIKSQALATSTFTPPTAPVSASTVGWNGSSAAISGTCSVLLNFTNAGVVDATAKNVLETVGNAQISTTQSKWGGGSMSFDGSGDWLSSPASPIWIMSGDWTLEGWIYPNSVTGVQVLIDTRNRVSGASSPVFYLNGTSLVIDTGAGAVISAGTISLGSSGGWQHIAATRSGNSWRLFINGSQVGSTTTNTTSFTTAYGCTLGSSFTNEYYNGYMDDVRVTKYARYTGSTYTVPTAPFPVQ